MTSKDYFETYDLLRENALKGRDAISLEFFLVDKTHPDAYTKDEMFDFIQQSCELFALRQLKPLDEAISIFCENIRYIVGYYGEELAEKWRVIITEFQVIMTGRYKK